MTGDPIDRTLVQPAADNARDGRSHRLFYLAGALVVVGVLGFAVWSWLSIHGLRSDVAAATDRADRATSSAQDAFGRTQQLYDQVVKLGAVPVVQPPPPVAVGPVGATGATGAAGQPGQSPPCLLTVAQCVGATGPGGPTGAEGKAGQTGATGPGGPAGPAGPEGKAGPGGPEGQPGVSVTRQYFDRDDQGACRSYNDYSDGRTRVDQGPAGDAACAPASPPTPSTTPSAILPTGSTLRRRD